MFHVYSKPQCAFCDQAKALLTSKNLPYKEFILDVGQPRVEGATYVNREQVLEVFPGARTMPQIALVKDDNLQLIGGFTELKAVLS
jgi:glutaredoxin